MDKRFYEGTLPRLAKGLEDLNDKLDKLTEAMSKNNSACPASTFSSNNEAEEELMEQAADMISAHGGTDLMVLIINELTTDADAATRVFERYLRASAIERQAINGVFLELTGWNFTTLVKKYLEKVKKTEMRDRDEN